MEPIKKFVTSNDLKIVFITCLYFGSAYIGIELSFPETKVIPLWPPSGVALALLLLLGYRTWPAVTIGSLIAYALIFLHIGVEFNTQAVTTLAVIAVGNTVESLVGYLLIVRFIKTKNPFLKTGHVFLFLIISMVMCLIGATIGASALSINQLIEPNLWTSTFSTWWAGNVVSILILTPLIISWASKFKVNISKQNILEAVILVALLSVLVLTMRVESIAPTMLKSFPFLIIPFLLWLGYRFTLQIASIGILLVSFAAIYFTIYAYGPFVLDNEVNSLLILQIFLGLVGVSTLVLSTTTFERVQAQRAMRDFNEKLEVNVQQRTKELQEEITIRETAEKKLKTTNAKLRKTNTELDNFVYRVSHDLRAPIASVLGITNLAKHEENREELQKYFSMISNSAEQQDEFIKEILDLSRNSRLSVQKDKIKMKPLLNEVFDLHMHNNVDKNILKDIEIEEQYPLVTDKTRLKVILNNIISNSIRYSNGHDPIIKIGVNIDKEVAKISINDNGTGISKKHIKNIFRMFYRATDVNAGSGLGLYIVKETIDKLAGNIVIDSKEKEGTNVLLEIPNLN